MQIQFRSELGKLLDELKLPKIAAEIGTAEGRFAQQILSWGVDKLYLVDAWKTLLQDGDGGYPQSWHSNNLKEVHERIAGNEDKVVILQGLSNEMNVHIPDNTLGIAYIDCNHSKEGCFSDLVNYVPKVVKGGIVALHDYLNTSYGVKEAVTEFCKDKYDVIIIPDEEPAMASCYFIKK